LRLDRRRGLRRGDDALVQKPPLRDPLRMLCLLRIGIVGALLFAGLRAAQADQGSPLPIPGTRATALSARALLGRELFFDTTLSASGRLSCASCHSPEHAYGPPNALAVQLGGEALNLQGARAVPSLRYVLNRTPLWHKEYVASAAERLIEKDEPPAGGFGWDGRFNSLHEQATFPLLAANEMGNADAATVVRRLRQSGSAATFRKVVGKRVFEDPKAAFADALLALERFELEDPSFRPYSSKFDDYLDGKVALSAAAQRGLALFDDPKGGNCASCHLDRKGADGSHPLFTDFEHEALGVPRNPELLVNADPQYFDLGLCGPLRTDQAAERKYCGLFKTPTLRNVATRGVFFHNGRYHTLTEALKFYVTRDTDPQLWYPAQAAGEIEKFDDLPPALRGNIDVIDEPLTRSAGESPAWTDGQIEDVIAFLHTLTDRDVQPLP
jgi:cytochrome c peroxidase